MAPATFTLDISLLEKLRLPIIYQNGEPAAVVVDIRLFQALIDRLEELEDQELFSDSEIIAQLEAAQADHLAGRVVSYKDALKQLGLESEL
jgi:PHD/YefM family antitoxin component YafN of YafNO toxin-antitoxin module